MKKGIIILITLIIIFSILCFFKEENKVLKEIDYNPYEMFSFYKENNLNRYKNYFKNNNYNIKDTILRVNIGLDNGFYTNTKEQTIFDKLMIINKYNYVTNSFLVNNLVKVNEFTINDMYLEKEAMEAFVKMARDAYIEGYNIRCVSSYRTIEYQENLYNKYVKKDGISLADTYSARPGFSEHHTGLAIDIDNTKISYNDFENTKEFIWMNENAHKYGYILRYQKGKEDITGYMYEPWHYRYVGINIATYIKENNITYEEYYYEFLDKENK